MLKKINLIITVLDVVSALYIMANGLGLIAGLDFGAGSYFYADIPNFSQYTDKTVYISETPMWLLICLFLIWGWLMYRIWTYLACRTKSHAEDPLEMLSKNDIVNSIK